ncbi:hypothetical protein HID58_007661 [Brassica napus]|uniref:Pyruvate carboxyltransferase domain-containing protein n=1 Tax=Brassica napus TaxID=3708 RepID=A0ABQ8EF07_BRANA|nr:hypothetical protein HID58_007661 [Brassica napus]
MASSLLTSSGMIPTTGCPVDEETGYIPVICVIARSKERDIKAAWESVKYAKRPRILVFTSTSDIHMKYKLKMTREEVVEITKSSIRFAKSLGFKDIEFGCEDSGSRSDKDYICKVFEEAIKACATTVAFADTVGINMPQEYGELVRYVKANTPGINDAIFSVHCHNDLGVATANTIAGVCAGARQVEVTINGIGERSGNASLEEVVMALKCRGAYLMGGVYTRIDRRQIMATSKMVRRGRHAVKGCLKELGYEINDEKLNEVFSRFRDLTKQKKRITDDDLKALVTLCGDEIFSSEKLNGNEINSKGYAPDPQISSVV